MYWRSVLVGLMLSGCSGFKNETSLTDAGGNLPDSGLSDGAPADANTNGDAGPGSADAGPPDASVTVTVESLVRDRSRLGARSTKGFRPWRSGIAVSNGQVYWVESGTAPGLYVAPVAGCTAPDCPRKVAALTMPTSFFATKDAMYISDTSVLQRVPFATGTPESMTNADNEIMNITSDGTNVFWTSQSDGNIRKTDPSHTTNSLGYSNGTPIAMSVARDRVYWAGVDISGRLGALQYADISTRDNGEVSRFSDGFHAMGGHPNFLYYAKDTPGAVHRITMVSGADNAIEPNALGVQDFAVTETHAYWVEPGNGPDFLNGRVRRVAHDSQSVETLAVSIARPIAIAVEGNTVMVASSGTSAKSYSDGVILRLTISSRDL